MPNRTRVLSLGAGVQSSTLLLMSHRGLLPKLDLAIFADTGWESESTYVHLEWLKREVASSGMEVWIVSAGNIYEDLLDAADGSRRFASIPCFCMDNGKMGMLRRQCTHEYKVTPIRQAVRQYLGIAKGQRAPRDAVEQWIGISTDEGQRMRVYKPDRMVDVRFPLIQSVGMSRYDCLAWLRENYPDIVVPRSACIGCPFRDNKSWRQIKDNPIEWEKAINVDNALRGAKLQNVSSGSLYLHRSGVPLEQVDLTTQEDHGQLVFNFYKMGRQEEFIKGLSILEE